MESSSSHAVNMPKTDVKREVETSVFSQGHQAPPSTRPSRRPSFANQHSRTTMETLFRDSSGDHRPPSPPTSPPQVTVDMIVQAYITAARKIDREPDRQNSKFALFASFMLMISTGAFVLSFEQAQKWHEELFRKKQQQQQQSGDELKKEQTLITVEMAVATTIFFVGLIFAMTLMLTGTFSNRDMQRSRFYLFCAWFLVMSTLVSPSLPVVGIIGAAAATAVYIVLLAVYIVLLVVGGYFAARPLIQTYQRSFHED